MLSKIATAGQNGQFRTPRHIIQLMVEMVAPNPKDIVCDPACGRAGFLVAAGEYLREHDKEIFTELRHHFNEKLFNGFDFDSTMLRIGSMNMLLHGVENPNIRYKDSLAEEHAGDEEQYTLVLANPPFAGSLDYENTSKDLQRVVKTKKTELLFLALFLLLLKPGRRAAVIVPDGVLFGSSNAHKALTTNQIRFIDLIIDYLTQNGVMDPRLLYTSPFTDYSSTGLDGVFSDKDATGIVSVLDSIREAAVA
jgi:type I restriction enzyme M protein